MRRFSVWRTCEGRFIRSTAIGLTCLAIGFLGQVSPVGANDRFGEARQTFAFKNSGVVISSDFPGGRLNDCRQTGLTTYEVSIRPENTPINNSAWYAFQVQAEKPHNIRLRFRYQNGSHRYWPKVSDDGENWRRLKKAQAQDVSANSAEFELAIGSETTWVAAQELLSLESSRNWTRRLAAMPFIAKSVLGFSLEGREIEKLEIGRPAARNRVFVIARQHPPEISGAIGMRHFVETIAGSSELARRFRESHVTVVVPVVNPDGVANGHWRHNAAGVDLNRDWGPFHQRETRALRDELLTLLFDRQRELRLFLDFHSTYEDLFYTQPESADGNAASFTKTWLTAIDERFPNYDVKRDGGHGRNTPTSKNWVHKTFGIPSITYEYGDETDRDLIRKIARGAAEEMMRLMLDASESTAIAAN